MSTLVIEELITELSQQIRMKLDTRSHIASLAPYIYMHNAPAGTFTLSITGTGVNFSKSFTCADIKAALNTTNNYAHVFMPVVPLSPLYLKRDIYTVKLSASGYTFSESSFLAWIKEHEDVKHNIEYIPTNDEYNPFSMRIKVFEQGIIR